MKMKYSDYLTKLHLADILQQLQILVYRGKEKEIGKYKDSFIDILLKADSEGKLHALYQRKEKEKKRKWLL